MVDAKDALAEEIAEEGTVLLKNENSALPLATSETVTLWGLNSHDPVLGGMIGSTAIVNEEAGQPIYNIEDAFTNKGITLNQDMITFYSSEEIQSYAGHPLTPSFGMSYEAPSTYNVGEAPASAYSDAVLVTADTTATVVVISRNSSEAADYE